MQWRTARRRRGGRPARRAADQGPDRAGAAHGAGPGGRVDPVGARGRGPPAHRGTPARARRRRPGDRHRPGVGPRLRRSCSRQVTGEKPTVVLSDEKAASKKIADVHRRRDPLDGGGADGLRGRRRAAARGRRLRDHAPRRRCSSPRRSAGSCGPASAVRPRRSSCRRCRCCSATPPRWRSSATTCSGRKITDEDDIFAAEDDLLARAQAGEGGQRRASSAPSRRWGREARFDRVLYDGGEFGHAGEVHVGSEEEMDFLGIPGLLEPDQVRDLLRHRQSERARRTPAARAGADRARSPPTSSSP